MDLNFVFQWNVFAGEENLNEVEDEEKLEADFEAYKSKVYSLTVPLKLVALRGSVPPSWIKVLVSLVCVSISILNLKLIVENVCCWIL
jgi:hypothetical protein